MDGKRIAAARNAKGWSQKYLGQKIGVSQQAIAKYEGPSGDVSGEKLLQLSEVPDSAPYEPRVRPAAFLASQKPQGPQ